MNHLMSHVRANTLRMHQWCVNLPGACDCEPLFHWRGTTEPLTQSGALEPMVAADLDCVNSIRSVLRAYLPEFCAWTEWQHQQDSVTNRGAEQGDVFGTTTVP